jgi:small GTP-binding protein
LVARFVESIFSERYQTTVGVLIERKTLRVKDREWHLILWDLAGEDAFLQLRPSYLRGAAGYLLVADGTRPATLDVALQLNRRVQDAIGQVPCVLVLNKRDLAAEWEVREEALAALSQQGWRWVTASAKTGHGVDEAFQALVDQLREE